MSGHRHAGHDPAEKLALAMRAAQQRWETHPGDLAEAEQAAATIRDIVNAEGGGRLRTLAEAHAFLAGIDLALTNVEDHLADPMGCLDHHVDYLHDIALCLLREATR